MKRGFFLILSLFAAFFLFMVLSFMYDTASGEEGRSRGTAIEVVLKSALGEDMDFWTVVDQGLHDAAREFDVAIHVTGPPHEKDIDRQIEILDEIIEEDPSLIILAATDYVRLAASVEKAQDRGIPVITVDSGVKSKLPLCFVATDNLEAGEKAGEYMKSLLTGLPGKKAAIVSHIRETATAIERERGVRKALGDLALEETWFCDTNVEKAYRISRELLKNPEIGGIVALNEGSSLGVARAVAEAGNAGDVMVVAFDNAVQEMIYLEEGVIQATVVQRPYNMGYLSVKAAAEVLENRKVEAVVDTGSVLITKDNMFERGYQELLFPFSGKF